MNALQNAPDWTAVEHFILDFGGVLYEINHQATAEAFSQLGADRFLDQYAHGRQSPLLDRLECGQVSDDVFLPSLLDMCAPGTTQAEVQHAWLAVLIGLRPGIVPVLQDLAGHYDLILFSNTNALHAAHFERQILEAHGRAFSDAFQHIIYSHRLGQRKPQPEAYRLVTRQLQLSSKRCFFVDDTAENVLAAQQAGWSSALHQPHEASLKGWLKELGCPIWD